MGMDDSGCMRKIISLSMLFFSVIASADDTASRNYVGALLGPYIGTHNSSGTEFAWGAHIGTAIVDEGWTLPSVGLAVLTSSNSSTVSGINVDGSSTLLMAELLDRQVASTGLYFGARFGLTLASVDLSAGSTSVSASGTTFAFSPVIGYEVPLAPRLALTLDASWITFLSYSVTFPSGTSIDIPSSQGVGLLGGLTYRW